MSRMWRYTNERPDNLADVLVLCSIPADGELVVYVRQEREPFEPAVIHEVCPCCGGEAEDDG